MTATITSTNFGTRVRVPGGSIGTTRGATEFGDNWIVVIPDNAKRNTMAAMGSCYPISELEIIEEK